MATFAFDFYHPGDPLGDVHLPTRLDIDGELIGGEYKAVGRGVGEGVVRIHTDHPVLTWGLIDRRAWVRFVRTDTTPDQEIGGFFLDEGDFAALSAREVGGRILTFRGLGGETALDRYVLGHSVYATGQTKRGDRNVIDEWTWNDEPLGGVLKRAIEEGQEAPDEPLGFITPDFDRTDDSNGNPWSGGTAGAASADYHTPIGSSVYKIWGDFLRLGLVTAMDPDFTFHAYRDLEEYRTDRTGAAFGAGVARFEAGVNVASEVIRRIQARQERTHVLTRNAEGDYQTFDTGGSGIPSYAFLRVDTTADPDAVEAIATASLADRSNYVDQATVTHIIGAGVGEYCPGPAGDYWLLDLVTLHTGTDQYDLEDAPIEVASIRFYHDPAGNWMVDTELGAEYVDPALAAFQESLIRTTIRNVGASTGQFPIIIDGVGVNLTTGTKGMIPVKVPLTIEGWTALTDAGTFTLDLWVGPLADYPGSITVADSIVGSDPIAVASGQQAHDDAPTGWSPEIPAESVIVPNLSAVGGSVKRIVVMLKVRARG